MYRIEFDKKLQQLFPAKTGRLVEVASDLKFGDYTTNAAMRNGISPSELAQKANEVLAGIAKAEPVGGFVNFRLSDEAIEKGIDAIIYNHEADLLKKTNQGKRLVIEFSSPNIAKPFSVGHLRSTIIGNALANLYEAAGWEVIRLNYPGDWGTQFGKLIAAIKHWGDEKLIAKDPMRELFKLYVKFHSEAKENPALENEARDWFVKLEQKDPEVRELWQKIVAWSLVNFDRIYNLLGVKFDAQIGESFFEDRMAEVVGELRSAGLLKESEGAQIVELEEEKLPPGLIIKTDGSTLYLTRDLASMKYRLNTYSPDKIIIEAGNDQTLHFRQVQVISQKLNWLKPDQFVNVRHGLVRGEHGKMSTRKGEVIFLEDVLDEAIDRSLKVITEKSEGLKNKQKTAEAVGIGAVIYNDLKQNPQTDIVFDWAKMLSNEGNSGPYLQYTYARIQSVLEKAKDANLTPAKQIILGDLAPEKELARYLIKFTDYIESSEINNAPNLLAEFLFNTALRFNNYYAKQRIITKDAAASSRLLLVEAVGQVLERGLNILGMQAPKQL